MKAIMKSLLSAIAALFLTVNINAQQPHADGITRIMNKLTTKLSLSADQQNKIKTILIAHRDSVRHMRPALATASKADKMNAVKTQWQKTDDAIMKELNDRQKESYKAYKAELREDYKQSMKARKAGKRNTKAKPAETEVLEDEVY